jgi:hypothetical protein
MQNNNNVNVTFEADGRIIYFMVHDMALGWVGLVGESSYLRSFQASFPFGLCLYFFSFFFFGDSKRPIGACEGIEGAMQWGGRSSL